MKIFISGHIHPDAVAMLKARADIVDTLDHPEEWDGAVVRVAKIPGELLRKATKLKVVGKHGVGYDNIDVATAKELGIRVVYTPTANANSVAELIISLLLASNRRIALADANVRRSVYDKPGPKDLIGHEIVGTTAGLVGVGKVGSIVGHILRGGFGCRVLAYDPFISAEKAKELGMEKCDNLDALLEQSDFVNISVPLTDATRGMIGRARLQRMKPTAVLVNAARGGIVDEKALYETLKERRLFAAACDAFDAEPPTAENPLASLDNFIATPHIGSNTEEALYRMGIGVAGDVLRVLDGEEPLYPV